MRRYAHLPWIVGIVLSIGCVHTANWPGMTPERLPDNPGTKGLTSPASATAPTRELPPDKAAQLCLAAADEMEKAGHLDHAVAQCELALKHNPQVGGVERKLAGLFARQGKYDQAIEHYQKEVARTPRDADLLNDLGYCCYEKENFAQAEKYLRQAVALKPGMQRAQGNLGLALGRQQKWQESLEAFKKAGSVGAAHANLATMYHVAGQREAALRECKIALGLEPQLVAARDLLTTLEKAPTPGQVVQAEARMPASPDAAAPRVEPATEAVDPHDAIRLSRPVPRKPQAEPGFRPLK